MHATSSPASRAPALSGPDGALNTPANALYASGIGPANSGNSPRRDRIPGLVRTHRIWANQAECSAIMRGRAGCPAAAGIADASLAARAQGTAAQWARGALGMAGQLGQEISRAAAQLQSLAARAVRDSGDVGRQLVSSGADKVVHGVRELDRMVERLVTGLSPWAQAGAQVASDAGARSKAALGQAVFTAPAAGQVTVAEFQFMGARYCIDVACQLVEDAEPLASTNAAFLVEHDAECRAERFAAARIPWSGITATDGEIDALRENDCLADLQLTHLGRIGNLTLEAMRAEGAGRIFIALPQEMEELLSAQEMDDVALCIVRMVHDMPICVENLFDRYSTMASLAPQAVPDERIKSHLSESSVIRNSIPTGSPAPDAPMKWANSSVKFRRSGSSTTGQPTPAATATAADVPATAASLLPADANAPVRPIVHGNVASSADPYIIATMAVSGALVGAAGLLLVVRKACMDRPGAGDEATGIALEARDSNWASE